jgi:type VI secretion system FHA domain protein
VRGKPTDALNAFFRGAGIQAPRVDAQQAEAILLRLGQLVREMILGISESLHLRAEQKNALRVPNTTIQQQNNNPLKFSASVEETLMNLLFRDSQEYLTATEAVREAYADLRLHQLTLLSALRGALAVYANRLDPDQLEHKFSRGKSGMLMGAANKLKYWDLYKDVFQLVADHPPGEFPAQFLDDFAQAYESEIARAAPAEGQTKAQAG